MPDLIPWLSAFFVTQAVEVPIYALALGREPVARSWPRRLGLGFLASAITHPVVWFVLPALLGLEEYARYFVIAESFAVVAEATLLRIVGVSWTRALVWALVANGSSVVVGLGLRAAFGWP